jgi:NADH:ubiquinone oxidoreductase subunit 2 (subunit N)
MADRKDGGVRGLFLIILGLISIGIGASLYYGELGVGSLTNNSAGQQSANPLGYLPIGLGAVLIVAGFAFAVSNRR